MQDRSFEKQEFFTSSGSVFVIIGFLVSCSGIFAVVQVFVRMFIESINQIYKKLIVYKTSLSFSVNFAIIVFDKFLNKGTILI